MSRALARSDAPGALARAVRDVHIVLGACAALVLVVELVHQTLTDDLPVLLQAAAAATGLLYAWRVQNRLRLVPLLLVALGFQLGWVLLHLAVGANADVDSTDLYRWQGNALLDGEYPRSEYPVGAVLLFAFESGIGGGATRTANALTMIPFQLAIVAAVWATQTRFSSWLAAFVALWPLNAYYWEFKFDLVAAALLAVGLVLAIRERWAWSGAALGLGAAVKWIPGVAFVVLVAWLLASRRWQAARAHALAFGAVVLVIHVPFLLWRPSEVLAAYEIQGDRSITPESIWYLFLRPFGQAEVIGHVSLAADAPGWADTGATIVQTLLVLLVVAAAIRMRGDLRAGVALAALAPVVFLLTNRIYSPQFVVVVFAAVAIAAALLVRSAREQLAVGVALAAASLGNAFVYPFALPWYNVTWVVCSAALFGFAVGTTTWIAFRSMIERRERRVAGPG